MAEVVQILTNKERLQPLADSIKTLKGSDADITLVGMEDTVEEANSDIDTMAGLIEELEAALEGKSVEGGGTTVETCMVKFNGPDANYIYTTIDETGAITGKVTQGTGRTYSIVCNTVAIIGREDSLIYNGTYTCEGATMLHANDYSVAFFITASPGETATITYISSGCCFIAGTLVLVSLDGSTTPIEEIKVDDDVVSYNIITGENYVSKVKRVIINTNTIDIAEVYFANGASIIMNAYHPIYTENGFHSLTGYNGYDKLTVGDVVKTVDGWTEVVEIKRYNSEPITTYNLDVMDNDETIDSNINDTYYANGIVVHNVPTC